MDLSPRKTVSAIFSRMRESLISSYAKENTKTHNAPTTDEGNAGGDIQNGYSYLDTNVEWQGQARRDLVRQMVLDEKINQVLVSYKNPINSASFFIKPAVDEKGKSSPEDEANALALHKNLFDEMEGGFREFLRNATSCLEWGHAAFEEVYYYDGYWKLKKMAFRDQHTIEKWQMENGQPGIHQRIDFADSGESNTYDIPMKKLFILTMNKVGKNPEGVSLLRPIYRQWKIKDMTWKYQVRILEKFSGGILQVWTPKNATAEAIAKLEEIAEEITASKRAGIVHPGTKEDGWQAEFMDLKIGDTKIMETLEKLDASISESMLNSFLDSAKTSSSGSFARTDSLKEFFYMALNGWLDLFVSSFNEVTLKRLAYYNGWERAPKLCYHPIRSEVEIDQYANAVKTSVEAGMIIATDEDENVVRNKLGFPEKIIDPNNPERRKPEEEKKEPTPEGEDEDTPSDAPKKEGEKPKESEKGEEPDEEKKAQMKKKIDNSEYSGCVMLNLSGIEAPQIDKNDISEEMYSGPLHLTLLYGINTGIDKQSIIDKVEYSNQPVKIRKMGVFEKEDGDVLILEVEKEDWLTGINDSLKELDYQNDYPEYTPHITLAYLKKGKAKKYMTDDYDGKSATGGDIVYTTSEDDSQAILISKEGKMSKCCHDHHDDIEVANLQAFQKKLIEAQHASHFSIGNLRQLVATRKDFSSPGRELTQYEKKSNLGGLNEYIDAASALLEEQMTKITEEQKEYLLELVQKSLDKNDLSILTDAKLPAEAEMISLLTEMSKESFEAGKITAAQEIGSEVPKTGRAVLGTIRAEQVALVTGMIEGMKANAISSTTQILKRRGNEITNVSSAEAVANARTGLDTYITRQKALYNTGSVISSINSGRTSVFDDNSTAVVYAQYSAILDGRTTERCRSLDGRIVKYGSGEYYDYSPPGHFYCRSIWVGILKDDPGVDKINLKHIPASIAPTGPLGSYKDLPR